MPKHPKYSQSWYKELEKDNEQLKGRLLARTERLPNETTMQLLTRIKKDFERKKRR